MDLPPFLDFHGSVTRSRNAGLTQYHIKISRLSTLITLNAINPFLSLQTLNKTAGTQTHTFGWGLNQPGTQMAGLNDPHRASYGYSPKRREAITRKAITWWKISGLFNFGTIPLAR